MIFTPKGLDCTNNNLIENLFAQKKKPKTFKSVLSRNSNTQNKWFYQSRKKWENKENLGKTYDFKNEQGINFENWMHCLTESERKREGKEKIFIRLEDFQDGGR